MNFRELETKTVQFADGIYAIIVVLVDTGDVMALIKEKMDMSIIEEWIRLIEFLYLLE